jgi:hypothetical protein
MQTLVSTQRWDAQTKASHSQNSNGTKPVWIRVPEATRLFGIGRSRLYELVSAGKIRSRVLKKQRDALRGIRLLSYDSLEQLIEAEGSA